MITREEYATQMQQQLAKIGFRFWRDDGDPQGHILSARWHYWHSKYSANPAESLTAAKNQYRLARDMKADPAYYTRRPGGMSCWTWFQRKAQESAAH